MTGTPISRRRMLVAGGLTLGVGVIEIAAGGRAAAAAEPVLEAVAADPVTVLSADGVLPGRRPRQLAVRVRDAAAGLPSGTRLSVTYDPRLFAPVQPIVVTKAGRPVLASSRTAPADPGTGLVTATVTLTDSVLAADADGMVAVFGTAHPLLYPHDLVPRPVDAVADLVRTARRPQVHRSLRPRGPAGSVDTALPWGVEISGVWQRAVWADSRFHYWYPVRVTLTGTGPGRAPTRAAFAVALDPQVVREVMVESATLDGRPHRMVAAGAERSASLYRSRWRSTARLDGGEVLDVHLRVSTLSPVGALPSITHPVVTLLPGDSTAPRRLTGRDDLARHDSVYG